LSEDRDFRNQYPCVKTREHRDGIGPTASLAAPASPATLSSAASIIRWALAPDAVVIDRTNVNAWEEAGFVAAVEATGRKKLIMGGLWTDVCLAYPAIEAANAGYEVLVPEDTIGSISQMAHDNGMKRMQAAGVTPITWNVVLAELQRDHARSSTEKEVTRIFMEYLFKMDPDQEWK